MRKSKELQELQVVAFKGHAKTPWPYQITGARFLQTRDGAILGDQVGLGKTLQAIIAVEQATLGNILLVVPKSHKRWWIQEIVAQEKAANVVTNVEVKLIGTCPAIRITLEDGRFRVWFVGHYEILREQSPFYAMLADNVWGAVVVDEVHKISNHETQRAKGLAALRSYHRWGLTGSPIADKPDSLWGLLHWVAPDKFPNKWGFLREHFWLYEKWGGTFEIGRCKNPKRLREVTAPYILVRAIDDIGLELPAITALNDRPVPLDMEGNQLKYYKKCEMEARLTLLDQMGLMNTSPDEYELVLDLEDEGAKWITNALSRFTVCHRAASLPPTDENVKMEWLQEYVESGGAPAVIFTRYIATKDAIIEALHSWLPEEEADKYIVGTYAYMSHGHNLQHLHVVIQWDVSWSRLEFEQAIGRVHRQGQMHPVQVYELQCSNSVDEYIAALVHSKQTTAEMLLQWLKKGDEA